MNVLNHIRETCFPHIPAGLERASKIGSYGYTPNKHQELATVSLPLPHGTSLPKCHNQVVLDLNQHH